ncbi:sigma-70 family RNA polymerase sigma factor [Eubacteriales bacterium OttesenSCG-928-N13]|nr:sigma-70 family RNA polymerase sigma factor [Eubacteriales bacterium OttesenSCG-928-N13]
MQTEKWFCDAYMGSFDALVKEAGFALRRNNLTISPEDVAQDVCILMFEKRDRLVSHPNITGWLILTMRNKVKNLGRKRQMSEISLDWLIQMGMGIETANAACAIVREINQRELQEEVFERITSIVGEGETELLYQYMVDRIPLAMLAEMYDTKRDTLKRHIYRVRKAVN